MYSNVSLIRENIQNSAIKVCSKLSIKAPSNYPGAVARSDVRPPGMRTVVFDPHVRQNILSLRLGHEKISTTILYLRRFKKGSCQLLAKEWALSTGKLPRRLAKEQSG